AVGTSGACVGDGDGAVGIFSDGVIGFEAGVNRGVASEPALDHVVAGSAGKIVVAVTAGERVIARTADHIFNQRSRVVIEQQRVGDIADRDMSAAEIGQLR